MIKKNIMYFFVIFIAAFSAQAEENQQGFIVDDLSIFMHAGPGTNYRILGTINAGSQMQTTGKSSNEYSEIIDDKNRMAWVETKFITIQPGLRFAVANLNDKLASGNDYSAQLDGKVNDLKSTIDLINKDKEKLKLELEQVQQQLKSTQSKVKDQDTSIKKQWFFNGAIVLGVGLVLGLILPKFFTRRRSTMDSWE